MAGPGDPAGRRERQVPGAQVRPCGADRERDVDPVVDDAAGAGRRAQPADPYRQVVQLPVGHALGPHLHQRCAGGQRTGDDVERAAAGPGIGEYVQAGQPDRRSHGRRRTAAGTSTAAVSSVATVSATIEADRPLVAAIPSSPCLAVHQVVHPLNVPSNEVGSVSW